MIIKKQIKDLESFAKYRITHTSGEEHLGEELEEYEQVHLAVAYSGNPNDYLDRARVKLAKKL